MIASLLLGLLLLAPGAAWACATCVAGAYGDRTFNWAFLGLLLMPFVVGLGVAGVLVWRYRALSPSSASAPSRSAPGGAAQLVHEESSL